MKSRPILFSAPMVRALLNGSKTQTRRIVKPQPTEAMWDIARSNLGGDTYKAKPAAHRLFGLGLEITRDGITGMGFVEPNIPCPYGQTGDQLWVRETWAADACWDKICPRDIPNTQRVWHVDVSFPDRPAAIRGRLRPSIHMPRWASRITLEITGIRCERLRQITGSDAHAEGCPYPHPSTFPAEQIAHAHTNTTNWYKDLWESINGHGSWDANPWVWVVELKKVTP
jgi:hypothetical protein